MAVWLKSFRVKAVDVLSRLNAEAQAPQEFEERIEASITGASYRAVEAPDLKACPGSSPVALTLGTWENGQD